MVEKKKEKAVAEKVAAPIEKSDEPSWYHYVIILLVFSGIILAFVLGFSYFEDKDNVSPNGKVEPKRPTFYNYDYQLGQTTYHLKFRTDPEVLKDLDYVIEPTKMDLLNTKDFIFAFNEYNGTDNGEVSKGSSMLISTLKLVYKFKIPVENIVLFNETNCSSSNEDYKMIVFDAYSNVTGVFMDEDTYCIHIETQDPKDMSKLVDKFIYDIVNEE